MASAAATRIIMSTTTSFINLAMFNQTISQTFTSEMPETISQTFTNEMPDRNTSQSNYSDYWYDMKDCNSLYCVYVLRYREAMMKSLTWLTSLLGILGFIGALGNGTVVVVFLRTTSKHTSMYFMLLLAILDSVVCILVIPGVILSEWHFEFHSDALCKVWEMLRYFSIPASAMILVAIACDRFILICTPPNIRMTKTKAKIIIGTILVISLAYSVPPILGMGVYALDDMGNEQYTGYCISNYLYITLEGLEIYWYFVTATFGFMIIIIASLYTLIFITVYKQNKKWKLFHQNKVVPHQSRRCSEDDSMIGTNEVRKKSSAISMINDSDSGIITMFELKNLSPTQCSRDSQQDKGGEKFSFDDQRCPVFKARHYSRSQTDFFKPRRDSTINGLTSESNIAVSNCPINTSIPGPSTSTPIISRVKQHNQKWDAMRNMIQRANHSSMSSDNSSPGRLRSISQITNTWRKPSTIFQQMRSRKLTPAVAMPKVRSRRTHIKTTQVLFTVTMVYIISFLPTFLMSNSVLPPQKVVYYMYFINNAVNPLIYSFMNPRFRQEVVKLFRCKPQM